MKSLDAVIQEGIKRTTARDWGALQRLKNSEEPLEGSGREGRYDI